MTLAPPVAPRSPFRRAVSFLARPPVRAALVLALACAVFVGAGSRDGTLTGDPVRYAAMGREIVERGDPTRLTLGGEMVARKPPLVFWMDALSFSVLGFHDFAARLPSQAMGLATVALLMLLVARANGRRAAFFAGLSCATWYVFKDSAATCRLESTLAFLSLASVGLFLRIDRLGPSPLRALGLGGVIGLAILTKGPPGFLPAVGLAVGALLSGRGRTLVRVAPLALLAVVLVAAPWYALQVAREGPAWWAQLKGDLTRDNAPIRELLPALSLYATTVLLPSLPWLPGLAAGTAFAIRRLRRRASGALLSGLLLAQIGALLATLPFLPMHYARYFAQVVPMFAWIAGVGTAVLLRRLSLLPAFSRWPKPHRIVVVLVVVVVFVGYPLGLALRLFPSVDRQGDLRAAAKALDAEAPGVRVLPTYSASRASRGSDEISVAVQAAASFYFRLRLVPYDPKDATQAPYLLFRHQERGPVEAEAFDAERRFTVLARSHDYTLYRTR